MEYVRLAPESLSKLVKGIDSEISEGMKECIEQGLNYVTREFLVGSNIIFVEIPAWEPVDAGHVCVMHKDHNHQSPRLEAYIAENIKSAWGKAEDVVREERITERQFEDYLWRNLRYQ